jgi:hypothetical protein
MKMRKKILSGFLAGALCLGSLAVPGYAAVNHSDINFFLEKIATTNDETKKQLGIRLLNIYVNTDDPDIEGLKQIIKRTATKEDIAKLEKTGYSLNEALDFLDILGNMKREDIQKLIQALEKKDLDETRKILKNYTGSSPEKEEGTAVTDSGKKESPKTSQDVKRPEPIKSLFKDIENHWGKADILFLADRNIIKGQGEGQFIPEGRMTRAEFTTLLIRLLGLKDKNESTALSFNDVHTKDWFYDTIKIGKQYGLVQGITGERFAPNDPVTREQMVTLIMRAVSLTAIHQDSASTGSLESFKDKKDVADWAAEYVHKALSLGIIKGKADNYLDPKGLATRAEGAAMMKRVYDLIHL